ncbi:hypothetical protein BpHYR1_052614 [Brachionus plicatilis]|uniref:Uncharacterized protein n=1 Tax=Brachionus plicatilis TaxID=10195 RepID=A0A3M7T520_BRAPC|nr:hypothetical protein BpHYR1_052614 [Brachionus plicatilis]
MTAEIVWLSELNSETFLLHPLQSKWIAISCQLICRSHPHLPSIALSFDDEYILFEENWTSANTFKPIFIIKCQWYLLII